MVDLKLEDYNVRDATLRSLLALASAFGIKSPTKEQLQTLQDISDDLENRVQDEIEKSLKNFAPAPEEEEMYPAASDDEVFLNYADDVVIQVIHKGIVYGRFCNEPVDFDHSTGKSTYCIKQWEHRDPIHEDSEGGHRL